METILVTIIAGLFSLGGIWYQNHLNKKSSSTQQKVPSEPETIRQDSEKGKISVKANNKPWIRILFTIMIVVLPWLIYVGILPYITYERFGYGTGREKAMISYYFVWFIITMIAITIGWKGKTIFEKIILIGSDIILLLQIIDLFTII
jgi:hypothetical protein